MTDKFQMKSVFAPRGDQPAAIEALVQGLEDGLAHQVLLGITGSGKTFTMASVIERMNCPTLVMAHNKTLAAQLHAELKALFPDNAVEYFISYYDYYQPEAYVPATNTFIEKDASINEAIDRMRHAATRALLTRRDVIVVASVSCIYGIGAREDYRDMLIPIRQDEAFGRDHLLRRLVEIQYDRNDTDFARGTFRVRGDTVEVFPVHESEKGIRIEFWGDTVERISEFDALRGHTLGALKQAVFFPGTHYVMPQDKMKAALSRIRDELQVRLTELDAQGKLLEKQRLTERTLYDLEMIEETGHCAGIENYSRHLEGRGQGEPAATLLDYFPDDYLLFIDESHQTVSQVGAMYRGDRSRKETLVEYGFRLPSALDNRPLRFAEFEERMRRVVYVSATPAEYELQRAGPHVVSQVIRPTGLVDPEIIVRPVTGQVDDLLEEIRIRAERNERVLITTLTKRMAEELTEYYTDIGVRVRYLHSDIDTTERVEILRELRAGTFDVLVGINLLREGLDLPEVSLVGILDADKEGFLRSSRSLIQTIGRAARNVAGQVIMYADTITRSMKEAIDITVARRAQQLAYNAEHKITPQNAVRNASEYGPGAATGDYAPVSRRPDKREMSEDPSMLIEALREEMLVASAALEFEKAAALRDEINRIAQQYGISGKAVRPQRRRAGRPRR
ncbi:MAG: excinuclease ABC subunit UvrB [Myxococcales bacterium]|jgi:excinuclease ABC subunit B|nr:excinuclease ABC subunit UvrB [Myxococcales bacterium]